MNDELQERYYNDPVFHSLVESIVESVIDGKLDREDWFDAIRMADRVIYLKELHEQSFSVKVR